MSNRLASEKSPYLLQHAHNPVDWYPWGDEAFQKARAEDKPIFLSIGYSTCHWCHVMERESFENADIARIMNEHFVSIKVDREERPDVDQIYMNAVQGMTGSGGWPLSAFLDHELRPFWGGTYFPPESRWGRPGFPDILKQIAQVWKNERPKLVGAAQEVADALKFMDRATDAAGAEGLNVEALRRAYAQFRDIFDPRDGGFGGAPKFPRSETISLLLRIHRRTEDASALHMAKHSLEKMARGGIFDHLGGGFHRYSTDAQWLVPHFEKMLYDNALLARAYLEAHAVDPANPLWSGVARETLDYVLRDMTSPEGGFYSAEDADSEGVEGKFYVWSEEELRSLLSEEELTRLKTLFPITAHGNFEEKNILTYRDGLSWELRNDPENMALMAKLFEIRKKRIPPYKDDKILASWNGLMLGSLAFAAQVLGDEKYLKAAQNAADFIFRKLWHETSGLKRRYREGEARFAASLDDYTFVIQGLLDLYETDFDSRWYRFALDLQTKCDESFWDTEKGGYFFTDAKDPSLIARSKDIYDGAVPSGNSIAALNLLRLYDLTLEEEFRAKADRIFKIFARFVESHPQGSPALLMAVDYATDRSKQIVIVGPGAKANPWIREIRKNFMPNHVLTAVGDSSDVSLLPPIARDKKALEEKPTIYVCENHACRKPVTNLEEIWDVLVSKETYRLP
jgi:uncharacterized protein YyaL (SSP411 family)